MKFALLAAAAVIATPVLAQDTPGAAPTDQTAPAGDPSRGDPSQGDPTMQTTSAGGTQTTADTSGGAMSGGMADAPTDATAADATGGYQPSGPATSGPVQPGAQVVFQQAPSPSQAFPPPPPMKSYPICKKGQYDNCMQRGGK